MKNNRSAILALTPISNVFNSKICETISVSKGELEILELSSLRRESFKNLISKLISVNVESLYLVYEDNNAKNLISVLSIVAALTRSKNIYILDEKASIIEFKRFYVFYSLINLITGTVRAFLNLVYCYFEMLFLLRSNRINAVFSDNKNVLYVKTNLWYGVKVGGSIGHISGVVNSLINHSNQVTYLSMETPVMLSDSVKVVSMPSLKYFGLPQELNLFTFQNHIVKHFRNSNELYCSKYDFIYSRLAISNYANVVMSRKLNVPLVVEYNGSEVWVAEKWGNGIRYRRSAQMAEDICLKHAHLIVVISQVLKDELLARGIEEDRILFYPNCVDPLVFNPNRFTEIDKERLMNKYNLNSDHKIFTFVGTFGQWHGAEKFAEAIKYYCENKRDWLLENKVHFILVGDGLKMGEVKNLIDNDTCKEFTTLTGLIPQTDAPIHLAISYVLISPHVANADGSNFFGSPTKLFEYMASGKAIIASDLDQIGIVLKDSLHVDSLPRGTEFNNSALSILVKPGNVMDLIKAIEFIVKRQDCALILGRNASIEAMKKYVWDIHVEKILDSYNKLNNNIEFQ